MLLSALYAQAAVDSGSPGYVVAAVIAVAALVLLYLAIVAVRVRDAAQRLDALEQRLTSAETTTSQASFAGDPALPPDPDQVRS